MHSRTTPHESLPAGRDRRRIPRYSCSGLAQITCLPLYGSFLRGRVRDLGLGGCRIECIETVPLLDLGAKAEVLVEVNSWFFRAMAHVRAIRGRSGISMEFMRMSAGGSSMLEDLIADLERSRSAGTRQERPREHPRSLVQGHSRVDHGLAPASHRGGIVGTIVAAHAAEEKSPVANHRAWLWDSHPIATSIDIFV